MSNWIKFLTLLAFFANAEFLLTSQEIHFSENPYKDSRFIIDEVKRLYSEQHHELAFQTYLNLLEHTHGVDEPSVSSETFQQALNIYLNPVYSANETAYLILKDFLPYFKTHPEDHLLGFLIAISYANLYQFDAFFEVFYPSYQAQPNHYLAFKTLSTLYTRLFEKEPPGPKKEEYRKKIVQNLEKARELNLSDVNLHKLILFLSRGEEKKQQLSTSLIKIINNNIVISRSDISYFVQYALEQNEINLAQIFLNKMKEFYPCSKVINQAQLLVENKIKNEEAE